jgi:hypothetical protein
VCAQSTDNVIVLWSPQGKPRFDIDDKKASYLGDPATTLRRWVDLEHAQVPAH